MSTLPTPSTEALQHSDKLKQHLLAHIRTQPTDSISFAEFMQIALYEPGLGYYAAGSRKFGKDGDFITAPELSPLFSHCLARQCIDVLGTLPERNLLEIGAGSGIMAADILLYLEQEQQLPAEYLILETSPELQQRQESTLTQKAPHLLSRVRWLAELPPKFSGMILANELLDALPVHLFELTEDATLEKCITIQNSALTWDRRPAGNALKQAIDTLQEHYPNLQSPYTSEVNLALTGLIQDLSQCLDQGIILFIDYGFPQKEYYHPERNTGTLMCHYRHQSHPDPLLNLGLQDITAHVDFTAVAMAGINNNLDLLGYTNQASFLLNTGLLNPDQGTNQKTRYQQNQAIKMLTLPTEMGELFKVMALGKQYSNELLGFKTLDQCHRL